MAKPQKIKRHQKINWSGRGRNRRATLPETVIVVAALAVIAALGWLLYTPIYNFIMGFTAEKPSEPSQSQTISSQPEEAPPVQSDPEESSSSQEQGTVPTTVLGEIRGVYMPAAYQQSDLLADRFLDSLEGSEINAVLVDLKDTSGIVHYQSDLEQVAANQAQSAQAADASWLAKKIEDRGYTAIGRISAFQDRTAPKFMADAAVKYQGTQTNWIDNSVENGGKPWLNPYSQQAQQYISDLASEAAQKGFEVIILDSVQFPTGYSLELASYGDTEGKSRQQVLTEFVDGVQQRVAEQNCRILVQESAGTMLTSDAYGENPAALMTDGGVIDLTPAMLGAWFQLGEERIDDPVQKPYETVDFLLGHIQPQAGTIALLQDYTAQWLAGEPYGRPQVEEQLRAMRDNGLNSYILYDPEGTYDLK